MEKFECNLTVSEAIKISEESQKRGIGEIKPGSVFIKTFPSGAVFIGWGEYNGEV
jgi:hypothetical protein